MNSQEGDEKNILSNCCLFSTSFEAGSLRIQNTHSIAWLAQLEEHMTLDLGVMISTPTLGVEIT